MSNVIVIEPEQTLHKLERRKHQHVTPLGYKPMPDRCTFMDGMWYEPARRESITHPAARKWLTDLAQEGVYPVKVTIRHETTRLLMAPKVEKKAFPYKELLLAVGILAASLAAGFAVLQLAILVFHVVLFVLQVIVSLAVGLLVLVCLPVALVDPQLIVTLRDGRSYVVYSWVE